MNEEKKLNRRIKLLTIGCCVLAVAVIGLLVALLLPKDKAEDTVVVTYDQLSERPAGQTPVVTHAPIQTDLVIFDIEELEEVVLIKTSYGDLQFSSAYSDLLTVSASNEPHRALEFFARLNGEQLPVFTLHFADSLGTPIGTMKLPDEREDFPVTVSFHEVPAGLNDSDRLSFLAAQELFNDILVSLSDNDGFTASN